MAVLGTELHTLADITARLDPDGKTAIIGEWLSQSNEVLDDMLWAEGNLPTGERTTVRVGLPTVTARGINQGVDPSKSRVAQVDEGAAMFEGQSDIDRQAAMMSGNPDNYRLTEATAFYEALNQAQAQTLFYGNAATSPQEYTGFAPRFNSLSDLAHCLGPDGRQGYLPEGLESRHLASQCHRQHRRRRRWLRDRPLRHRCGRQALPRGVGQLHLEVWSVGQGSAPRGAYREHRQVASHA